MIVTASTVRTTEKYICNSAQNNLHKLKATLGHIHSTASGNVSSTMDTSTIFTKIAIYTHNQINIDMGRELSVLFNKNFPHLIITDGTINRL